MPAQRSQKVAEQPARQRQGGAVGGGVESLLHGNWSLRLEYRFSQLGSETVFDYDGLRVDLEPSMHTARLLLTYRFGHRD